MRQIQVTYDGKWPCACHGTLTVVVDGETVYSEKYTLHSTGSCRHDENWEWTVEEGCLVWEDAHKFDAEIREAVEEELSKVRVCCGGCI